MLWVAACLCYVWRRGCWGGGGGAVNFVPLQILFLYWDACHFQFSAQCSGNYFGKHQKNARIGLKFEACWFCCDCEVSHLFSFSSIHHFVISSPSEERISSLPTGWVSETCGFAGRRVSTVITETKGGCCWQLGLGVKFRCSWSSEAQLPAFDL